MWQVSCDGLGITITLDTTPLDRGRKHDMVEIFWGGEKQAADQDRNISSNIDRSWRMEQDGVETPIGLRITEIAVISFFVGIGLSLNGELFKN